MPTPCQEIGGCGACSECSPEPTPTPTLATLAQIALEAVQYGMPDQRAQLAALRAALAQDPDAPDYDNAALDALSWALRSIEEEEGSAPTPEEDEARSEGLEALASLVEELSPEPI